MPTAETGTMQIEVRVDSVRQNLEKGTFNVILKEVAGPRYLLIFIDQAPAKAMADILPAGGVTAPAHVHGYRPPD